MDKLIQISKIFECTLDDLTNDSISLEKMKSNKQKNPLTDILTEVEDFINKSVKMFSNMNGKEIVSLLFFMLLVALGILFLQLPIKELYVLGERLFMNFGEKVGSILSSLWYLILGVVYTIIAFVLFFYVYKAKYLNRFQIKTENLKKESDEKLEKNEQIGEKKVCDTSKELSKAEQKGQKGWSIVRVLGIILMFFVKGLVFFFSIPFIIVYVFIVLGLLLSIYLVINGVIFFGIIILLIATIILITWFLELIFDFLFNKEVNNKKRLFVVFIVGLVMLGIGCGITMIEVSSIKIKDEIPNYYQINTYTQEIDFRNDLYFNNSYNVEYVSDNALTNKVKIEIKYYDTFSKPIVNVFANTINIYSQDDEFNMDFIKNVIKDLKNKTIYNYGPLNDYQVTVYSSDKNITEMKKNYIQEMISNEEYDDEIEYYENKIVQLEEEINNFQDRNTELEEKINDCQNSLQNYKDRISSLLEE